MRWRRRVNPRVVLAPRRDLHTIEGEKELDEVASKGAAAPACRNHDAVCPIAQSHSTERDAAKTIPLLIGHQAGDCVSAVLRDIHTGKPVLAQKGGNTRTRAGKGNKDVYGVSPLKTKLSLSAAG